MADLTTVTVAYGTSDTLGRTCASFARSTRESSNFAVEHVVVTQPDDAGERATVPSSAREIKVDENRFEQELIYYLEKLDINEEKVRLANHLDYFLSQLNTPESNGKKLGFIVQEIGREINTIGSKANFAPMQKAVIQMKNELEKIKEQLLNVL